ncbi:hypothetical protein Trydic_g20079 [Trypoxylus dichotomus]
MKEEFEHGTTEMRFLGRVAGYTRMDRKRNIDTSDELGVRSINEIIGEYRQKWSMELRGEMMKINKTSTKEMGRPELKVVTVLEPHTCSKTKKKMMRLCLRC